MYWDPIHLKNSMGSSAKMAGVQFRGKVAEPMQADWNVFTLLAALAGCEGQMALAAIANLLPMNVKCSMPSATERKSSSRFGHL